MERITVVVRKAGGLEPDYSVKFEVPTIPRVGTYLSIHRDGSPRPFGEDLIVRQVWWRLEHPDGDRDASTSVGKVEEIIVECAKAIGPYSTETWRKELLLAEKRGVEVEEFDLSRAREIGKTARRAGFNLRS